MALFMLISAKNLETLEIRGMCHAAQLFPELINKHSEPFWCKVGQGTVQDYWYIQIGIKLEREFFSVPDEQNQSPRFLIFLSRPTLIRL